MKVCELIGWLRTLDPQGEIKVDYDGMYHDPTISKASKDWDEPGDYILR